MSLEHKAIVTRLMGRTQDVLFEMGPVAGNTTGNNAIRLLLSHPAYSALFAMAMASFMNKKQLTVRVSPHELNGESLLTIEWA